jgi:hypothetical protein
LALLGQNSQNTTVNEKTLIQTSIKDFLTPNPPPQAQSSHNSVTDITANSVARPPSGTKKETTKIMHQTQVQILPLSEQNWDDNMPLHWSTFSLQGKCHLPKLKCDLWHKLHQMW